MKISIKTKSIYNDLLLAKNWFGVAVILLATVIFISGCSDKEENMISAKHMTMATTEKSGNTPFNEPLLKQGVADNTFPFHKVIFLDAAQGGLFKRAFDDFKNRIYAKDRRLFVAPPTAAEPADALQWYKIFYEAIAKTNELIEKGEITVRGDKLTWEHCYVSSSHLHTKDTMPPGNWELSSNWGFGGVFGYHELYLSHQTATWLFYAAGTAATFLLSHSGLNWASATIFAAVGGSYWFYNLYGNSAGFTLKFITIGFGVYWIGGFFESNND